VYSSAFTVGQTTTVKYRAFDNAGNGEGVNSQLIRVDTSAPVSSIKCNGNACAASFYTAAVSVALDATDTGGSSVAQIVYTTDGSDPTSTNGLVYTGAFSLGATATVKYRALDNAGNTEAAKSRLIQIDTTPPTVHLDAPSDGMTVSGETTLSASASDDVAVDHVDFLVDGSRIATASTSPYSVTWDSSTVPAGPHTISARAVDTAGNSGTSNSVPVIVANADTTPPVSSIRCNGGSCAGWFTAAVSVTLTATDDSDGSGVATIVYTTDGSDPSLTNGTVYLDGFTVPSTTTVKFRAYDNGGNAEAVQSQLIQIDTTPPTVSLSTPSEGATVTGSVTLSANAQDDVAVDHVDFLVDGNQIASVTSAPYDLIWDSRGVADGSHTIAARATDGVGHTTTSTAVNVTVSNPDTIPPVSTIRCNGTTCATGFYTAAVSVTLSASDTGGSGLDQIVYTTDGSDPTATNGTVYTGAFTVPQTTTVRYRAFDNADNAETVQSQLVQVDTTAPLSAISCNNGSCASWFNAPVSVTLSSVDDTGGSGVSKIVYTTDGSTPTSTHGTVYAGAFAISGSLTLKYRAFDNAGNAEVTNSQAIQIDTAAPSSTIKCNNGNCATSFYAAAVSVTHSATDSGGSGVSQIVYTIDGSDPTSTNGAVYTAAFTLASTATVKYRAFDRAGNAEAIKSQLIRVDTTAPVSSINCNGAACGSGWFNAPVSVTLSASDNSGGSGLSKIVYTTDGSTPTSTHGTTYAAPFTVSASPTTVKYRAFDSVGNAENTNSLTIQIDTVTPASMIRCNAVNCSASYYNAPVSVTLSASDVGGSGVSAIVYTTDNSTPTQSNGTVYTSAFTVASTITVKYRSFDGAGNAEPVNSALIQVDTTPPSSTLNCSGSPCSGTAWYPSGVSISLSATDDASGVSSIRYTTNGTVPTKTTGTLYSSSFTLIATTTINYRAFDNAGNSENNHALTVQVDSTVPTVSVTSPSAGATVAGSTTISANASDNVGVARIDFLVDGNVVGSAASAPYNFTWNSASVADGNHTVSARAADLAGNQATSTVTVTVANANLLPNGGLEAGSGNTPNCWFLGGFGTNTFAWTWNADGHSGSHAENLNISSYTNGDRKLLTAFNGSCSLATAAGRRYTITAWYKSDAKPALMAFTSTTGPTGAYGYLGQSPQQTSASGWTQATWTTPAMPAGTTNLSVGMGLVGQTGSLTMDDFGAFQAG